MVTVLSVIGLVALAGFSFKIFFKLLGGFFYVLIILLEVALFVTLIPLLLPLLGMAFIFLYVFIVGALISLIAFIINLF